MKTYNYQNNLIGKKQLRQLLSWSFTNYDSMQACSLADELKYLGFKYASQAGISISIEDLKVPFVKNIMLETANQEIQNAEKIYLKGKITDVERFQKIIDTWNLTSESLKNQIIYYFKNYDPLNSVYIMAFSGARGNLSQVRQLVGMRGLMSDPSGQILNLPIRKNFREGLTITDYLMSGYGARKGIVDTALKTANSGYLTRRLIDVAQDILIREKDCFTTHSFLIFVPSVKQNEIETKIIGRVLSKNIVDLTTNNLIASKNTQLTSDLFEEINTRKINKFYLRSPLTCNLYRAVCQKCYGWDLASENLIDIGEAIGILAGQSIGEPGTQLTMRTFHTGGIFTAEMRQQIVSPLSGVIQFYKNLETVILRTNRGEDVLMTKNSGSLTLIPATKTQQLIQIEVSRNTIIFPKNNQYILKDTVIGELINTSKQIKNEIKPIVSNTCGEIYIPPLKQKINLLNNNKLIWILSGQLYNSSRNSFLNFYPDYKLNKNSYIFRTKLIGHYTGFVNFIKKNIDLYQQIIRLQNQKYLLQNTKLTKLAESVDCRNYLLKIDSFNYLIKLDIKNSKNYLQLTQNEKFGTLISKFYKTQVGGRIFYNVKNLFNNRRENKTISYSNRNTNSLKFIPIIQFRTAIWLEEEVHTINCESNILLVEHGDFISKKFELIPGLFSKTSGLVRITQKQNIIKTITIKSGIVYEGKKFNSASKKLYYPGEILLSSVKIKTLSFCDYFSNKDSEHLLLRPVKLYEFPYSSRNLVPSQLNLYKKLPYSLFAKSIYSYKSNQSIQSFKNLTLISNILKFRTPKAIKKNITIELTKRLKANKIYLNVIEQLDLLNYLPAHLRYTNIQSCFLIQRHQFISPYIILGYLEACTKTSLEIVKFKIKKQNPKQIFLISNNDCITIEKEEVANKKLNDFITSKKHLTKIGKIIINNSRVVTIQKGRPYFFPNCKQDKLHFQNNLQYKIVSPSRINSSITQIKSISLNYSNIAKIPVNKRLTTLQLSIKNSGVKSEFSKLFIKKNGKFYSCLIPLFFKKFKISSTNSTEKLQVLLRSDRKKIIETNKIDRTILVKSLDLTANNNRSQLSNSLNYQMVALRFVGQQFQRSTKFIGLYSITEDYFERDVNNVFCTNKEFIEKETTIGLLNLEKEITGDIIQGLPRIEEILEARKKNIMVKRIPSSQKKSLLIQKTCLDNNFEFKKIGLPIQENDKINPHKLLKVYFNYYGLVKSFLCDQTNTFKSTCLIQNYEGCYKSFKKAQLFILDSVQSVYQSQGVIINDKHLEVIIKQMTTKVLITNEGDTPLLRREVIDLYHIQSINTILCKELKDLAYYVPLLLGITKASLNNPSFISAASFQETTRVLTKAAIEGKIDWLRGLKENIIIGHLIPAGTGSQNYQKCFVRSSTQTPVLLSNLENFSSREQKSRQST